MVSQSDNNGGDGMNGGHHIVRNGLATPVWLATTLAAILNIGHHILPRRRSFSGR